ncbi:MAG: outer membrane beta-barrel protein [Muribaculaceae bacterium]|nr:outer membrane beta-barrel protein [Muribaculaceae bacterium]MBR3101701.1 outer membrane beta-barrel protein [Muribaculaceae bacterium]
MNRLFAVILLLVALGVSTQAQEYRYEVGPALGVSGYLGDVNTSNMWKHPGATGGVVFRYIKNSRWAFKANLLYAGISGNSADMKSRLPDGVQYEFKASLFDLGAQAEFNFFNFGIGPKYKNQKRLTPYMVAGLGLVVSTVKHGGVALSLPLGIGAKYKLKERLNLGFEFTMRKSFGDNLDGLSDLYGVKHGFAKNTEWYSLAMFTVTWEFSKRCTKCHYVE